MVDERPRDSLEIQPAMAKEVLVLGRQEGVDNTLGHRVEGDEYAPLAGEFGNQAAVGGVDARHHGRLVFGEHLIVGQVF